MITAIAAAAAVAAAAVVAGLDRWACRHEALLLADLDERTHPYT